MKIFYLMLGAILLIMEIEISSSVEISTCALDTTVNFFFLFYYYF